MNPFELAIPQALRQVVDGRVRQDEGEHARPEGEHEQRPERVRGAAG